jgi:hypothetical protein
LLRDFAFFQELNQSHHVDAVMNILLDNTAAMFGTNVNNRKDKDGKLPADLILELYPQVRTFWAFTLVLCRYLLTGDQLLSLHDARFLGLVNEVVGYDNPEPHRVYRRRMAEKARAEKGEKPK